MQAFAYSISVILLLLSLLFGDVNHENSSAELLKNAWKKAELINDSIKVPVFAVNEFNITNYGAVGDGKQLCTDAINKAIVACNSAGGGIVQVPAGTFLTGAIHLRSNVNLHLDDNALLLFTPDRNEYLPVVHTRFQGMECMNYSPFIYAYKQENIAITGKGTIDGQGQEWWSWKGPWDGPFKTGWKKGKPNQVNDDNSLEWMVANNFPLDKRIFGQGHYLRPCFIEPYGCKNVLIRDITIKNSPMWVIHPVLSKNITIHGIRVESPGPNNDGCDPECCRNVLIENCYFNTGDDCIAIKSGRNADGWRMGIPSENIIIRNCTMAEGHGGIVVGSEVSGNVSNIFAENCIMDSPNLDRAIRIKSNSLRGGHVSHLYARNILVRQVKEAVLKINMFYGNERGDSIPYVHDIFLENIISDKSKFGIWIDAYAEKPVKNLYLIDCSFDNVNKDSYIRNVSQPHLENLKINGKTVTMSTSQSVK